VGTACFNSSYPGNIYRVRQDGEVRGVRFCASEMCCIRGPCVQYAVVDLLRGSTVTSVLICAMFALCGGSERCAGLDFPRPKCVPYADRVFNTQWGFDSGIDCYKGSYLCDVWAVRRVREVRGVRFSASEMCSIRGPYDHSAETVRRVDRLFLTVRTLATFTLCERTETCSGIIFPRPNCVPYAAEVSNVRRHIVVGISRI
jgi:hypothetical protein